MIEALAEQSDDGWIIKSPRVGIYRAAPGPDTVIEAGDIAGSITVLDRVAAMRLPAGVSGRVVDRLLRGKAMAVEYGQPLFLLATHSGAAARPLPDSPGGTGAAPGLDGLQAGTLPVTCPIDGVFYLRPSPGAAPFVQPGSLVETGRTLGLIEAMKSFNAVVYGGPGLPARAVVMEVRAADATEVRQGAVLFVVKAEAGAT